MFSHPNRNTNPMGGLDRNSDPSLNFLPQPLTLLPSCPECSVCHKTGSSSQERTFRQLLPCAHIICTRCLSDALSTFSIWCTVCKSPISHFQDPYYSRDMSFLPSDKVRQGYTLCINDEIIFFGKTINGRREGKGHEFIRKTNTQYHGGYRGNKFHGFGVFTSPQWKYSGEWVDGKRVFGKQEVEIDHVEGHGIFRSVNKEVRIYYGTFKDDLAHGEGTMEVRFKGERCWFYKGSFLAGLRHGDGVEQRGERTFEGKWENDKKHGYLICRDKYNRVVEKSNYKAGFRQGEGWELYYDQETPASTKVVVRVSYNYERDIRVSCNKYQCHDDSYGGETILDRYPIPHGQGRRKNEYGIYSGSFHRGQYYGEGTLIQSKTKIIFKGIWSNTGSGSGEIKYPNGHTVQASWVDFKEVGPPHPHTKQHDRPTPTPVEEEKGGAGEGEGTLLQQQEKPPRAQEVDLEAEINGMLVALEAKSRAASGFVDFLRDSEYEGEATVQPEAKQMDWFLISPPHTDRPVHRGFNQSQQRLHDAFQELFNSDEDLDFAWPLSESYAIRAEPKAAEGKEASKIEMENESDGRPSLTTQSRTNSDFGENPESPLLRNSETPGVGEKDEIQHSALTSELATGMELEA